jgi:two-component system cell cycle sensor histidine kinase PleC
MATTLNDLQSIERAYEAGATDFITKPINWKILVQRKTLRRLRESECCLAEARQPPGARI